MKEEVKDLWVAALRSGKYPQTTHQLRNRKGMCCMGVLCEISGLGLWASTESLDFGYIPYDGSAGSKINLPEVVRRWAGLTFRGGGFKNNSSLNVSLTSRNDDGCPFEEIATIIEANYLDL
jgi:hypothetical protein